MVSVLEFLVWVFEFLVSVLKFLGLGLRTLGFGIGILGFGSGIWDVGFGLRISRFQFGNVRIWSTKMKVHRPSRVNVEKRTCWARK